MLMTVLCRPSVMCNGGAVALWGTLQLDSTVDNHGAPGV